MAAIDTQFALYLPLLLLPAILKQVLDTSCEAAGQPTIKEMSDNPDSDGHEPAIRMRIAGSAVTSAGISLVTWFIDMHFLYKVNDVALFVSADYRQHCNPAVLLLDYLAQIASANFRRAEVNQVLPCCVAIRR